MPLPQKGQKAERKSWRDFLYLLAHILANPSTTRTVNDFKKLITSQQQKKKSVARDYSLFAQDGKKPSVRWKAPLMKLEISDFLLDKKINMYVFFGTYCKYTLNNIAI